MRKYSSLIAILFFLGVFAFGFIAGTKFESSISKRDYQVDVTDSCYKVYDDNRLIAVIKDSTSGFHEAFTQDVSEGIKEPLILKR